MCMIGKETPERRSAGCLPKGLLKYPSSDILALSPLLSSLGLSCIGNVLDHITPKARLVLNFKVLAPVSIWCIYF